jgi:hypothetical protein
MRLGQYMHVGGIRINKFMQWDTLDYSTSKKSNSVVIIGAGPSTAAHVKDIVKYIAENKSVVYAATYNFDPIIADYTYLNDVEKIRSCITKLRSGVLLSARMLQKLPKRGYDIYHISKKLHKRGIKVWSIGDTARGSISNIYKGGQIQFDNISGRFGHYTLGNAGFGAIAASLVSRPKKILIVGIDGHIPGKKNVKMCFNGSSVKKVKSVPGHKIKQCVDYLSGVLIPHIRSMRIKIEIFQDVRLWDINKKEFGILNIG